MKVQFSLIIVHEYVVSWAGSIPVNIETEHLTMLAWAGFAVLRNIFYAIFYDFTKYLRVFSRLLDLKVMWTQFISWLPREIKIFQSLGMLVAIAFAVFFERLHPLPPMKWASEKRNSYSWCYKIHIKICLTALNANTLNSFGLQKHRPSHHTAAKNINCRQLTLKVHYLR